MMESILAQLLNHIYELEQQNATLAKFIEDHKEVLKDFLPGSTSTPPTQTDPIVVER